MTTSPLYVGIFSVLNLLSYACCHNYRFYMCICPVVSKDNVCLYACTVSDFNVFPASPLI